MLLSRTWIKHCRQVHVNPYGHQGPPVAPQVGRLKTQEFINFRHQTGIQPNRAGRKLLLF